VRGSFIPASVGGLFQPVVRLGESVARGRVVATIRDMFGAVVEEIRAIGDYDLPPFRMQHFEMIRRLSLSLSLSLSLC
jgi:hypothetical protein